MDLKGFIDQYDAMVTRAVAIIAVPPNITYADPHHARLRFDRTLKKVYLDWPEVQAGYYNSSSIENQSAEVDLDALLMSEEAFAIWATEQKRLDAERREAQRLHKLQSETDQRELRDRAEWERLQKKFGGAKP